MSETKLLPILKNNAFEHYLRLKYILWINKEYNIYFI